MKNIILQHFTGDLRELDILSSENIKKYANKIGSDYRLILGQVFRPNLTPPCQKVFMLDKEFDNYDNVLMLDIDMFTRSGMEENVFAAPGIGIYSPVQQRLHKSLVKKYPKISSMAHPYWGGAIYKLNKDARELLRTVLGGDESWMNNYNKPYHFEDEGIMHTLATKANYKPLEPYLDYKWSFGSFEKNIENCSIIHIRTKVAPQGPKRPKIENYKALVEQGIIEE